MRYALLVLLTAVLFATNCQQEEESTRNRDAMFPSSMTSYSTRLHPNQDIMSELLNRVKKYKLKAVSVVSAIGSVLHCSIRFANNSYLTRVEGPMEIVSLSGTVDEHQRPHVHISLSNGTGFTIGGHLPSLTERKTPANHDCPIFTTLELVLAEHNNVRYVRKTDPETTFDELTMQRRGTFSVQLGQM